MPDIEVIRRVSLARHLSSLATDYLRFANDLYLFSAANLMQDAVEIFLLAVCDHVGASTSSKDTFDKYFVAINSKISPQELPFKTQLLRLNRVRVASKHDGIQPDRGELTRLFVSAGEFLKEVSSSVLGESFSTLSTIDLLDDSKSKQCILIAKGALESGDYETCTIECKKAMY